MESGIITAKHKSKRLFRGWKIRSFLASVLEAGRIQTGATRDRATMACLRCIVVAASAERKRKKNTSKPRARLTVGDESGESEKERPKFLFLFRFFHLQNSFNSHLQVQQTVLAHQHTERL